MAANFNLAILCVVLWLGRYLGQDRKVAGFALFCCRKNGVKKKMCNRLSVYHLDFGTLPFGKPHLSTYVMFVNTAQKHDWEYGKTPRASMDRNESRESVSQKITRKQTDRFPKKLYSILAREKGPLQGRVPTLYRRHLCED